MRLSLDSALRLEFSRIEGARYAGNQGDRSIFQKQIITADINCERSQHIERYPPDATSLVPEGTDLMRLTKQTPGILDSVLPTELHYHFSPGLRYFANPQPDPHSLLLTNIEYPS
jgi:hypothetical protein